MAFAALLAAAFLFRLLYVRTDILTPARPLPVCDRCGYDLAGLPESAPCPECRARQRRTAPAVTSARILKDRARALFYAALAWFALSTLAYALTAAAIDPAAAEHLAEPLSLGLLPLIPACATPQPHRLRAVVYTLVGTITVAAAWAYMQT